MRKFIKRFKESIIGKILGLIFKLLWWGLELLIVLIAITIITQRVTNSEKAFLGFRIFNVATGSMEPEYAVGDILISKEKDPKEIEVGDNIVYLGDEGGVNGKIITHSVIEIEQGENGEFLFHTKGRANTVEDPIVSEDQVYGVVVNNNIALAWLCKIITNRYGLYFCVVVPIVLYVFIGFVRAQGEKIEQEKQEKLERRRRHEEKMKRRRQAEIRARRRVVEVEEELDVVEQEEQYEQEPEEEILEESEYEEVIEMKPKKSTQKSSTKKKKTADNSEEVKEKTKKETRSGKTKTEKTVKEPKISDANKAAKETKAPKGDKTVKVAKTKDVESENKKTSSRKKAKEE